MAHEELPTQLEVPLASLIELAIEGWRLEHWMAASPPEKVASKLRHVSRRLQKFLHERELAALDLTGQKYEPGMAVEVLEALEDKSLRGDEKFIVEMVEPVVLWRGRVVKFGLIVVKQGSGVTMPQTKP